MYHANNALFIDQKRRRHASDAKLVQDLVIRVCGDKIVERSVQKKVQTIFYWVINIDSNDFESLVFVFAIQFIN